MAEEVKEKELRHESTSETEAVSEQAVAAGPEQASPEPTPKDLDVPQAFVRNEEKLGDKIKGGIKKARKPFLKSNKPMSNRIMFVVIVCALAAIFFIVMSIANEGKDAKSSKKTPITADQVIAANTSGLTLSRPSPAGPAQAPTESDPPPELVIDDDGNISTAPPLPPDGDEKIKPESNVRIVMKQPSQHYMKKRDMMLLAMASQSPVDFMEPKDDDRDASISDTSRADTNSGTDYGAIANSLFGGRASIPGIPSGGMGFSGDRPDNSVAMEHQDRNLSFLAGAQGADQSVASEYNGATRRGQLSRYELKAGSIISGVLTGGINSDLPGTVIGQVSENIFDTATGAHLLIPQGARIVGEYDSHVVYGQQRVLVVWKRIIYPDGSSLNIGGLTGSDQSGYSGFKQKIDNHYSRMVGAALFASVFVAAGKVATDNDKDKDGNESTAAEAVMEQMSSLGARLAERNLNVAPTLRILPGYRFSIITTKDMAFAEPYYE